VVCATCPAIEELTARDALIAALGEGNEALRVKVAALAEIAFGGSERRGGKGRDADEELGDRDDDSSGADSSGAEGDLRAPGPVTDDGADGEGATGRKRRRGQRRGAAGHGRRRYDHLEVRVVVGDLGEHEGCCGCCGKAYEQIAGDEISSEISWRVVVYRVGRRRRRYRRSCDCGGSPPLKVAPVPAKVIPKGLFSAAAIASVLVDKFALARPVNKIIASLSMHGLEVSAGSLAGVLAKVKVLAAPLRAGIVERTRTARCWQHDET
jgi:transposase